jgi:hypothetical protein
MPDRDPRTLAAWGATALALVLLTAWYLSRSSARDPAAAPVVRGHRDRRHRRRGGGARLVIDVAGAVRKPGAIR